MVKFWNMNAGYYSYIPVTVKTSEKKIRNYTSFQLFVEVFSKQVLDVLSALVQINELYPIVITNQKREA